MGRTRGDVWEVLEAIILPLPSLAVIIISAMAAPASGPVAVSNSSCALCWGIADLDSVIWGS